MMLVMPWLCKGSLANPGNKSSWSTNSFLPRENREGFTAGRTNCISGPSQGMTFQWQVCLWEQESGLCDPGGQFQAHLAITQMNQGTSLTPAGSPLVRSMVSAAGPGQRFQTPNWHEQMSARVNIIDCSWYKQKKKQTTFNKLAHDHMRPNFLIPYFEKGNLKP